MREGLLDPWFAIDKRLCVALRKALDQSGGTNIAIDYNLIIEERPLRDEAVRSALLHQLGPLPFENLVLHASHFGADVEAPKAARLHQYARSVDEWCEFRLKPAMDSDVKPATIPG